MVSQYSKYQDTIVDFHKYLIANKCAETEGYMEKESILEELRRKLVYSMRVGSNLCINLDKTIPDLRNEWSDNEIFPLSQICEFDEWREDKKYMNIVKEEERKFINELGAETDRFEMKESHSIMFLAKY